MSQLKRINARILDFEEKLHQAISGNAANFVIQQIRENLIFLKERREQLIKIRLLKRAT